ncbi:signal transduction histidine kinase/CheY-like chemotaxis protein [Saonia flava]|uniref:histidine kinase n=1 Tax=Saonia flava TaxID=523696 RepID=A0A846R143_9FLAO|nr:response regulator [Saonia flava]NJB71094.1 signal transduction histidine kinase/CheY-like chemotaxis protein [Saonia flava]
MSIKFSKKELILPITVFVVFITMVFILWNKSLESQKLSLINEIQTTGNLRAQEFFLSVKNNIKSLENLKQRIEMTNGSYFQYWEKDAGLILEQNPSFKFVEWVDSLMVIRKTTPLEGNEAVIDLNVSKHPGMKEWAGHVKDSSTNVSSWLTLYQGGNAFLVDVPVFFEGNFQGSVTAGMDFTNPFNELASSLDMYAIEVKDENGTVFYSKNNPSANRIGDDFIFSTTFEVDVLDEQKWTFSLMPANPNLLIERKKSIYIFFIFGVLLSLLSSSLVYFYQSSRKKNILLNHSIVKLKVFNESLKKERLKAEKSSKAKTEFISNMSHEIRTPLNAISGFIEVLKLSNMPTSLKQYLSLMDISSKKLLLLVDDILEIDKIESGKTTFKKDNFSPLDELRNIISVYTPSIEEKGLKIQLDTVTKSSLEVEGDMGKYGQIITNLLRNSLKFTERGGIKVSYEEKISNGSLSLLVSIKDTGIGIPKDKLKTVFNRFTQVDTGKTKKHEGSGLGLYITYKLVELFGGDIKVNSEENVGTEFNISLEFPLSGNKGKANLLNDKIPYLRDSKVLIVDDNKVNVLVLKKALEKLGICSDSATNGIEAVEFISKNYYDFVFMDVHMPIMDGFEATKEIRKTNQQIRIIGLSADVTKEAIEEAKEAGMNDYITKPISFDKLKENLINHFVCVVAS